MKTDETKPAADSIPNRHMQLSDDAKEREEKARRNKLAEEAKARAKEALATRVNALKAKAVEEEEQEAKAAAAQRLAGDPPAPLGRFAPAPSATAMTSASPATTAAKNHTWKQPPQPTQDLDVNAVAISGDGSRVVAGTFFLHQLPGGPVTHQVGFYIRDAAGAPTPNGDHLFDATAPALGTLNWTRGGIQSVAISRDGTWAACAGGMTPPNHPTPDAGFIYIYDVAAGTNQPLYFPNQEVHAVALSNDGQYLVAGADKVYVYRRNGSSWSILPPRNPDPIGGPVRRVAISGDGKWIAVAVDGGILGLIRNQAGVLDAAGTWKSSNKAYWVHGVAVANGGSAFAAAVGDGRLHYFSTSAVSEGPTGTLTFSESWNRKVPTCSTCRWSALSDDGSLAAAVGAVDKLNDPTRPGMVVLYSYNGSPPPTDMWQGNVKTLDGPNSVSIDSVGSFVAVADGTPSQARGGFYLFDGASGAAPAQWVPPGNYPTSYMNYHMALSADGKAAVGGSNDGNFYYFTVP
jgi:WD40 repeat protein